MKIVLTTDADDLSGDLNPNFGRCRRFLIYDTSSGATEVLPNPGSGSAGGAGIQAARSLVARQVDRVITGRVGPNARPILQEAGIEVVENRSGPLKTLIGKDHDTPAVPGATAGVADPVASAGCCFCERCGYCSQEDAGLPCFKQRCPNCGATLERKLGKMT
jgi:predicted Fe-Mo cluster-binding NifX family protein